MLSTTPNESKPEPQWFRCPRCGAEWCSDIWRGLVDCYCDVPAIKIEKPKDTEGTKR